MRTNIVIDDELIQQARNLTGLKTKREIVHKALLDLVCRLERRRLLELEGKVSWEGDLDRMRERSR